MSRGGHGSGLRQRAARGVAWSTLDALGTRLVTTLVFVFLARLLEPAAFGLVALSLVFIALTRLLVDQGFGMALVQRETLDREHLDTAFWASLVAGIVLSGGLALAAVPLSSVIGTPELAPVIQALSLVILLTAPSSAATPLLNRQFQFQRLAARRLIGAVAGGAAGVGAALAGAGVWSLVSQALVQAAVGTILLWFMTPYRPGRHVSRRTFVELFSFGSRVTGMGLVNFVSRRSDDLLIGTVLGPAALGIYSVAYRLLTIMNEVMTVTLETVSLATFSRLQADRSRLARAYLIATRSAVAVAAPAYLLVAVLAPDLIHTIFGPRWSACIPVMQVLALAGLANALVASSQQALLSLGGAQTALRLSTLAAVVNVIGFISVVRFGILAVAIAFTARAFLLMPLSIYVVKRSLGFAWGQWLRPLGPPLASAVTMAAVVEGGRLLLGSGVPPLLFMALALPLAGLLYLGMFRLMAKRQFSEVVGHLTSMRSTRPASTDSAVAPMPTAADPEPGAARGAST